MLISSAVSCVSAKKFRELQITSRQNMIDRDELKSENLKLQMYNKELENKVSILGKDIESLKHDLSVAEVERDKAKEELNILSVRLDDLQNAHEDLIKGNVKETKKLLSELLNAQENLRQKEDVLRQMERSLDLKKISLDELTLELEKKNARMAELEKILDTQQKIVRDLKNKVAEALLGFENNGLTITNRDGKVYVSLDEKLLFKSASWEIDANGKKALRNLAGVLDRNPGIQITIEGHTDNVPYNPGDSPLKDNWDLSLKRATSVVRVLLEGSRIKPERLTASGRSEYVPLDTNSTAEGRQRNRRTEIILTPDLTELYKVINQY